MCHPLDSEILKHHICLFALSTQSICRCLGYLARMVKLSEGDDMWQLCIEVCGILAYCMNIEECMSVEVETNGKPWYHDIKAYIKIVNTRPVQQTVKRSSSSNWLANFS